LKAAQVTGLSTGDDDLHVEDFTMNFWIGASFESMSGFPEAGGPLNPIRLGSQLDVAS